VARTAEVPTCGRGAAATLGQVRREQASGEIQLQSPPQLTKGSGGQAMLQMMFMLPMMLGMGTMSFVYIGRGGGPMTYVFGGLFVMVMVGMLIMMLANGGRAGKAKINEERRDYLRYLAGLHGQVRDAATEQRRVLAAQHPEPVDLWTVVYSSRLWERRRSNPEFGRLRLGAGPQRLAAPLRAPDTVPLDELDPLTSTALRHFIRVHSTVPELPVAISLRAFPRIGLSGAREDVLDVVRALLVQAVVFHSPADLRVGLCLAKDRTADWEWAKWLPHAQDGAARDACGPVRLVADDLGALAELFGADLGERPAFTRRPGMGFDRPHLVVVVDGGRTADDTRLAPEGGLHGVTVIEIDGPRPPDEPPPHALCLHHAEDRLGRLVRVGSEVKRHFLGRPDHLDIGCAEAVARAMAPLYGVGPVVEQVPMSAAFGLAGLLGLGDPRDVDPEHTWRQRTPRQRLRLPIGVDPDGRSVELDLKESAEGGMGPHGLVVGATGSGKSELLRTLVTGLAVTHSSAALNLALIDFKGGATFAGMTGLPHTCAVITNLAEDLTMVDRMADAINGELVRRQELLRAAGNYASVRDYERARESGADLAPLPALLVIIDEFSELLTSRPEFVDLFVMIGRLGRSLAVHLLLASQRLEEGRLRGLEAHLSYRIGLRTFSASESRAVLGVPDAYQLPSVPGSAYLKSGTDTLQRLKAAYVSEALPARSGTARTPVTPDRAVLPFSLRPVRDPRPPAQPETEPAPEAAAIASPTDETIMGAIVSRLVGKGPEAHQIWLPPLDVPPTLDHVLPALDIDRERGLCPLGWQGNGKLTVPVGVVDKPFERRDLLWVDLSAAGGNMLVLGAPQSGKSTLLRSLVASFALTHTPAEVQFFLLDMGGGALGPVAGLPHVSGHAVRRDPNRCRRMVAEVMSLLAQREQLFSTRGIDSVAAFRAHRADYTESAGGDREFGDVFLVVDDWATLREEYEQLEEMIIRLAARGLGFGIHTIVSANLWSGVRTKMLDSLGTRIELRLGDPADSLIDRRAAHNVPARAPGRGLTPDKFHFLGALPRVDGDQDVASLGAGTTALVAGIADAWPGKPAPQVRLLPRELPVTELPDPDKRPGRAIPIGIAESDLEPVFVDFTAEPHFLAFADVESGKSTLLRTIATGIAKRYTPDEARIIVADYRRALLGEISQEHLLAYGATSDQLSDFVGQVVAAMEDRLPGQDITPAQLRKRDWWTGPELFVLVDDYELIVGQGDNPLLPLVRFLPQARDIGLHLVVVRGSGGASRSLYDSVLGRIKELGAPGLVMAGDRDEGPLLGTVRPGPQPPGRGYLVGRRSGVELVQVAWTPPTDS
jgi:DNA segregation ATPase FtsK/SpoIIIE, S-DNA-T family